MTQRTQAVVVAVAGAIAGGVAGYMLFTSHGRELRRRMEPAVEDFARELVQLRSAATRVAGVASEGWHALHNAIGERRATVLNHPRQTSPF